MRIIIGGPHNSGILATGAIDGAMYNYAPANEQLLGRVRQIETVCARHKVPLKAAALQFPFGHEAVATTIPGARSTGEIQDNVRLIEHPVPDDFWAELKAEGLIASEAPTPCKVVVKGVEQRGAAYADAHLKMRPIKRGSMRL